MTHAQARTRRGSGAGVPAMLGIAVLILAALFAANAFLPDLFDEPLPTRAQDGLTLTLSVLIESLPFVALGVILSIAIQVWVPASVIHRVLPKREWPRRLALAALGILIPVCECGNVPFARGLMMRGIGPADTLAFLVAAPIVNPVVIITTHQAFGMSGGILIARLVGRHPDPERMLTERFRVACDHAHDAHGTVLERSLAQFVAELRAVMPALIIGSALAGAVQVIVPRSALVAIGSNPVLSIVAMIILAVTVSLCSNVDSFFALSFASTFTTGSLVAFLLVGPVVDIKMIALLRTTFTARVIVVISAVVVLAAFSVGAVMNLVV
jgi:uncharacterized membrane protein YraQ (UPF0718 family)